VREVLSTRAGDETSIQPFGGDVDVYEQLVTTMAGRRPETSDSRWVKIT
jgi:hypothetical protein